MTRFSIYTLLIVIMLGGCHRSEQPDVKDHKKITTHQKPTLVDTSAFDERYKNEFMVLGTLYHQQSPEYKALCYQAYNIGKILLDKDLSDKSIDKHRVVVLDIDETVLDNSPYQAQCILQGINYPTRWEEWCKLASAKAVPGVLDFLTYARANGVGIYYITNRKEHLKEATIANLVKLGCPMADNDHVFARTTENSKEGRRNQLLGKNHISLLFGDNLNDFSNVFEDKPNAERSNEVDKFKAEFGSRFVVLPNSLYGEWETALYDMNKSQPDSVKYLLRHKALKGF